MKRYLTFLQNNSQYRTLWLASVVTMLGDWFNAIGTVILINRYTGSGTAVAALFLARTLPSFLLGPLAGVLADRLNRKLILIISDVLRGFIVLGFLLADTPQEVWLVYVLVLIQAIVSAFYYPAHSAIVPGLLRRKEDLLLANTLGSITWSAILALGAALGGLTAAFFGVQTALVIDAATFFISGAMTMVIVLPADNREGEETAVSSGWADFVAGLRYVSQRPRIGLITLVKSMMETGHLDTLVAVFAATLFPIGEDGALTMGILFTARGVGAVLGPLVANRLGNEETKTLQRAIGIGFGIIIAGWLLLGIAPSLPLAAGALLLRSMGASINWTYSSALLQMEVPDSYLGRVFALDIALLTFTGSLSIWLTGLALDKLGTGPQGVSLLAAVVTAGPLLLWLTKMWEWSPEVATTAVSGD